MIRHVWADDRHKNATRIEWLRDATRALIIIFCMDFFKSSTPRLSLGIPCEYQPITGESLPVPIRRKADMYLGLKQPIIIKL